MLPERRHEVSRLEAFSDAAFAFALTLLVVKVFAGHHLVSATVGLLSVAFALLAPVQMSPIAPSLFALMGPLHWLFGSYAGRKRKIFVAAQR